MTKVELIVPLKAIAGKAEALQQEMIAVLASTRAEQGCEFYRAYCSNIEGHFFFHELWTSQEDLDRHSHSEHIQKFGKAITPLLVEPLEIEYVKRLE